VRIASSFSLASMPRIACCRDTMHSCKKTRKRLQLQGSVGLHTAQRLPRTPDRVLEQ